MKRVLFSLTCVSALLISGCSKQAKEEKEVPTVVKAEAAALVSEAQFAMEIREYARAEELIQRALKLREDMPEYWVTLGMAHRKQEEKDDARKAYKKALGLHVDRYKKKKDPAEIAHQAFVLGLLGQTEEALKLLSQGVKDHPNSSFLKDKADSRGLPRTFRTPEFKALSL
jgi:tetratricopeptide (TPR) repeat protein